MQTQSLYEALRELVSKRSTGRLQVSHWQGKQGFVNLSDGKIVQCQVGALRGREALEVLAGWITVELSFLDNVETLTVDVYEDTSELMDFLGNRYEEVQKLKEVVPGPDAVFALSPKAHEGRISVSGRLWKLLALVNGRNSVKDICLSLKASEFSVTKALAFLAIRGMVKLVTPERPLDPELREPFLRELEERLAIYIGPIASLMIQEALREMNKSSEYLTKDDLPLLVERISPLIDTEIERIEFQKHMLSVIQHVLSRARKA